MAKWLSGKKTYILAAVMFLVLIVLLALGRLSVELAFEVLVFAAPCFAATYRDALQTHHSQVMDVLLDAVDAGVALRAHNYAAIEGIALKAAPDAESLVVALTPAQAAQTAVLIPTGPAGPQGPQGPAGISAVSPATGGA